MNKADAFELLREWHAPARLITHVTLVGEAASAIIECLSSHKLVFDANFVEAGVVLHDVGKIAHPQELHEGGSMHEAAGQQFLLARGIDPKLARVCVSHGQWADMTVSLEELLIALADTLWKGKRAQTLEESVVRRVADSLGLDYWDLFTRLDSCFEVIAASGHERLTRSR